MIPLTPAGLALVALVMVLILVLPRRWVPVALLGGVCYLTLPLGVMIGPFNFFTIRMLILAGLLRVVLRREHSTGGSNRMDWLMLVWAGWALLSSAFHDVPAEALKFNAGLVFDTCGVYFLIRAFLVSLEDVIWLCRVVAILLVPVAVEMFHEKLTGHNLFSVLGGVSEVSQVREGRIRAQGPFAHPILAGTVGAVTLPLMVGLWQLHRKSAYIGIAACLTIAISSASSGPLMSTIMAVVALMVWPLRSHMRVIRWGLVLAYIGLDLVMKAPAYYILARIDIAGGSTGYHRAALIEAALKHLDEWWLGGTDYTRHWMPTGVSWSPNHTDITNHYLQLGVVGGLPLTLLFIALLWTGFVYVGKSLDAMANENSELRFFVWATGASLFAHTATSISVSYFDQSFVFLYLILAIIGTTGAVIVDRSERDEVTGGRVGQRAKVTRYSKTALRRPGGPRKRRTLT